MSSWKDWFSDWFKGQSYPDDESWQAADTYMPQDYDGPEPLDC